MKTILTLALSVMIFTGAMAQQNAKKVSLQAKAKEEVKLNNNSMEGSQSADAEVIVDGQEFKSQAKAKKAAAKQKLEATKEVIAEQSANAEASANSEVQSSGTISSDTHGAEVSNTAQSDITTGTKGSVVSNVASVESKVNGVVKAATNVGGQINSSVKAVPVNVKTDLNVDTDLNIKPKSINTKVRTATGIKL